MAHEPAMGTGRVEARDPRGADLGEASWSQGRIVLCRRAWAAREAELTWQAPFHSLLLTERGSTARTRVQAGGRVVYDGGDRAGSLSVVPAGEERVASYRDGEIVYAALWFDPALWASLFGAEACSPAALPLHVNGHEPVVAALLGDLSVSTARGDDPGTLYVEHLVALAWARLARLGPAAPLRRRAAPLAKGSLARVEEYIGENLAADLSVSDLARVVELEPDTFARKFKLATGLAPHAFVLEQRIQRSERLLAETRLGIASIALEVGFSSQSHMTQMFRRARGVTPHAYRSCFVPGSR
ncbi:MAG: AraC family transcriptional regulator [Deltaproteobacteria bacterium]